MSSFSYVLGALVLVLVLLRQVRVRPGAAGVPAPPPGGPRASSASSRCSSYAGEPPRLLLGLGLGARHPAGRRTGPRRAARPVHAGLGRQRMGGAPGQRRHHGAVARVAAGALRRRRRGSHAGAAGLEGASFLLYLGLTLAVQDYVVHRRALPLWAQLGPDAGRPLQVQFTLQPGARRVLRHLPLAGRGRPAGAGGAGGRGPRRRPERDRRRGGRGRRRPRTARAARRRADRPYTRRP